MTTTSIIFRIVTILLALTALVIFLSGATDMSTDGMVPVLAGIAASRAVVASKEKKFGKEKDSSQEEADEE